MGLLLQIASKAQTERAGLSGTVQDEIGGAVSNVTVVIGTIRRECLDHVIVFNQTSLSHHLRLFLDYYHHSRCHLAPVKDTPEPQPVQGPAQGRVISIPQVGGLHHRYERRAA